MCEVNSWSDENTFSVFVNKSSLRVSRLSDQNIPLKTSRHDINISNHSALMSTVRFLFRVFRSYVYRDPGRAPRCLYLTWLMCGSVWLPPTPRSYTETSNEHAQLTADRHGNINVHFSLWFSPLGLLHWNMSVFVQINFITCREKRDSVTLNHQIKPVLDFNISVVLLS